MDLPVVYTESTMPDKLKGITLKFLQENFFIKEGTFEPVHEGLCVGNRRFGWIHYNINNVEVAMLTDDAVNSRFDGLYQKASEFGRVGVDSAFFELFAPNFFISGIIVLDPVYKESKMIPGTKIHKGSKSRIEHFSFAGEYSSAIAYFAFAKLAHNNIAS